ncbi:MAG: hypothetical protein WED09_13600 [Homoserinimonas sp.]
MTVLAQALTPRFRYESDLVAPLREQLPRLMFSARSQVDVETFTEVPAVRGVPDLASIRFDNAAVSRRQELGIRPLTTDVEVRAVLSLGQHPVSAADLAARMRVSADYVRRAVIPLLVEQGWVVPTGKGMFVRAEGANPVMRRVVTVEAKLRDWHGALSQARRQRLSADDAYIALESSAIDAVGDELAYVAESGIGIITVDARRLKARIWARPKRRLATVQSAVGRMLIAERCLEMLERGEREGKIYPVFGWTRPESS